MKRYFFLYNDRASLVAIASMLVAEEKKRSLNYFKNHDLIKAGITG
jgi:hypothetical protein